MQPRLWCSEATQDGKFRQSGSLPYYGGMSIRPALIVVLFAAALPEVTAAQPIDARFTAGALVFADDGAVTLGEFGGSVRLYFSRRWSVEPELIFAKRFSSFARDSNYLLWGNVAFDFRHRDRRVVPYWFAAPGMVHHRTSFGSFSFSTNEASFGTGAGVRFMLSDRIFVAPQLRVGVADGVFSEFAGSIGYVLRK
jgi:outer membrane protein with beta-barrel domain